MNKNVRFGRRRKIIGVFAAVIAAVFLGGLVLPVFAEEPAALSVGVAGSETGSLGTAGVAGSETGSLCAAGVSGSEQESSRRVVFVGDSRTVGMYITLSGAGYSEDIDAALGNEIYIGRVAMGYDWFVSTGMAEAAPYLAQGNTDLVILMGCNDMAAPESSASSYASFVNANIENWMAGNNRVFFDSVNPVGHMGGGGETSCSIYSNDGTCVPFNETLKASLDDKVSWIDTYSYLVSGSYATVDGIHYDSTTYYAIHDFILEAVANAKMREFTVTLDPAGGSCEVGEIKVEEMKPLGDLPVPERQGYRFDGWFLDQTRVDGNTVMPDGDITLKASWRASDQTPYLVVFHQYGQPDETETRYGTTDAEVQVQPPRRGGYQTPAAQTQKIAADGSTRFDFTYLPAERRRNRKENGENISGGKAEQDQNNSDSASNIYQIRYARGIYDTSGLPKTYKTEDLPIVLKDPKMPRGTVFRGWYDPEGKRVRQIEKGQKGNLILTGRVSDYRVIAAADAAGILVLLAAAGIFSFFSARDRDRRRSDGSTIRNSRGLSGW